jgi:hypothetical protein
MFWSSIIDGLALFLHWQVWVAMVAYAVVWLGFMVGCGALGSDESAKRTLGAGCLYMVGGLVLQAVLMGLLVAWLLPIFFGKGQGLALSDLGSIAWPLTKLSLLAMVFVLVLSILPFVGDIVANAPGIQQYILAVAIFRGVLTRAMNSQGVSSSGAYPSFWIALAFGVVSVVLVYAALFGTGAALMKSSRDSWTGEERMKTFASLAGFGIGLFGGLIPFFMYTQYVRSALGIP